MEGRGRGMAFQFWAASSVPTMFILGFLALLGCQMAMLANADIQGMPDNSSLAFINSTHSQPYNFKQYVLMNGKDMSMPMAIKGTENEQVEMEGNNATGEMRDEGPKMDYQPTLESLIGKQVRCKRETDDKNGCKMKCVDIFPIEEGDEIEGDKTMREIKPFAVPWFPYEESCSHNYQAVPPSKLIITIGFNPEFHRDIYKDRIFICYASAFEGDTKMDYWERLKLENTAGNYVAKKCNQIEDKLGIKWHGIGIFRSYKVENFSGTIEGNEVVKRLTITDSMHFSYSGRGITLDEGEFFHQLILTEKGLEVMTSRRNIYKLKHVLRIKRHYKFYLDPEEKTNFEKRADLMEVDISSVQKIFYQFKYNASLWAVPYDVAILDPGKYNIPVEGIPNEEKLKILAMKALYSSNYLMSPRIDIPCAYEWKKVAPVALNVTFLNGTQMEINYVKIGYLKYAKSNFANYEWDNIQKEVENNPELDYAQIDSGYVSDIGKLQYKQIQMGKYANGPMSLKLNCIKTEVIYGWANFDPTVAPAKIEPDFDWKNDFGFFDGCKHSTMNLLANLDKSQTLRSLGSAPPEYKVEFRVGLTSNASGLELTEKEVEIFKLYHEFMQREEFFGQLILDDDRVIKVYKSFNLDAKFRELKSDFMKTFMNVKDGAWATSTGEFGLFQEFYDCPNFRVYLPQISGKIKFTFEDHKGKINIDFFGYSSKNRINFIDSYAISTTLGEVKCRINIDSEGDNKYLYQYGKGDCRQLI